MKSKRWLEAIAEEILELKNNNVKLIYILNTVFHLKICIKHKNQVPMLMGPGAEESSILSMFKKGSPSEESV